MSTLKDKKWRQRFKEWSVGKTEGFDVAFALLLFYIIGLFIDIPNGPFTFHIKHANVFHLITNMWAASLIFRDKNYILIPIAYFETAAMWALLSPHISSISYTVGFSSILFFIFGYRAVPLMKYFISKGNRRAVMIYVSSMILVFLLPLFIRSITLYMHIIPYTAGVLHGGIGWWYHKTQIQIANDRSRVNKRKQKA